MNSHRSNTRRKVGLGYQWLDQVSDCAVNPSEMNGPQLSGSISRSDSPPATYRPTFNITAPDSNIIHNSTSWQSIPTRPLIFSLKQWIHPQTNRPCQTRRDRTRMNYNHTHRNIMKHVNPIPTSSVYSRLQYLYHRICCLYKLSEVSVCPPTRPPTYLYSTSFYLTHPPISLALQQDV